MGKKKQVPNPGERNLITVHAESEDPIVAQVLQEETEQITAMVTKYIQLCLRKRYLDKNLIQEFDPGESVMSAIDEAEKIATSFAEWIGNKSSFKCMVVLRAFLGVQRTTQAQSIDALELRDIINEIPKYRKYFDDAENIRNVINKMVSGSYSLGYQLFIRTDEIGKVHRYKSFIKLNPAYDFYVGQYYDQIVGNDKTNYAYVIERVRMRNQTKEEQS